MVLGVYARVGVTSGMFLFRSMLCSHRVRRFEARAAYRFGSRVLLLRLLLRYGLFRLHGLGEHGDVLLPAFCPYRAQE